MADHEPCHDDPQRLTWNTPWTSRMSGTRWEFGWWGCPECRFSGTADDVGLFLDAIVRCFRGASPAERAELLSSREEASRGGR